MMRFPEIFQEIDVNYDQFTENILLAAINSKAVEIKPEHILSGLLKLQGGISAKRIIRQNKSPQALCEMLNSIVEDYDVVNPPIQSLENVPLEDKLSDVIKKLDAHFEKAKCKINEYELLSLLRKAFSDETIKKLGEIGKIDVDLFFGNSWPPAASVSADDLWHSETGLLKVDKLFDKSARKIINAMQAEGRGLGLPDYDNEILFLASLSNDSCLINSALRNQMIQNDVKINSVKDLELELRSRLKRPVQGNDTIPIKKSTTSDNLQKVFEGALGVSVSDGRKKIGAKDISEALIEFEMGGRIGFFLGLFRIQTDLIREFIATQPSQIMEEDENKVPLHQLENKIKEQLIGQDHVIRRILPIIKRLQFGYRRPGKPAGVFLFMGKSGTGKTQMAKVLAKLLYGSSENMIMLEMGQFGTKETKSMFIGAAPGYVGYGEGKLTNGLRDKPESVVLFDEIEKADPLVLDVLLRFLDEGQIDDPAGPVRDGSKCLIVLTSNFFADQLEEYEGLFNNPKSKEEEDLYKKLRKNLLDVAQNNTDEKIKKFFRPEFIFRIDDIVLFRSFNKDDYKKIAELNIKAEINYLQENYDLSVEFDNSIVEKIAEESNNRKDEGARVVNRLVNIYIVNPIIDYFSGLPDGEVAFLKLKFHDKDQQVKVEK